ncbi:WecB/TagA/CpsF family glycosyltransferase [Jiella pacifica]|uniref:WecB/TagA/CpsF family glycosyltransferase n=1 Tax=Jiella pacifica TaxID=2696469 RepID=A0A6N9T2G2_9HYPH|nr:WecB/TagA/CpsF family glycosyltransferase [Jiella pacifica]NDW04375.1 WecB/TagA/CpsF family glycosyltransferase [Jiella pacifica]
MTHAATIGAAALPAATILGARVHGPTLAQAVALIEEWIRQPEGRCRSVVATGFHGLWVGHQDAAFRAVLNAADLFCPDGIAPVWLSRLQGRALPARVPGGDLMGALLRRADEEGYRSYFYGDTDETLDALCRRVEAEFSGAAVAGRYAPPFRSLSEAEEAEHVAAINASGADILWVGLGCPKQERFIARNKHRLTVPVAIGVGAAFRFQAGLVPRAPKWLGDAGFEWAWRLAAEPRKMWRRDLTDGPRFLAAALADAWRVRRAVTSR